MEAYDGPGAESLALNFSLQTYAISRAFFELWDRLDGDYSYKNFHATAEGLADGPILIPRFRWWPAGRFPVATAVPLVRVSLSTMLTPRPGRRFGGSSRR